MLVRISTERAESTYAGDIAYISVQTRPAIEKRKVVDPELAVSPTAMG